MVTQERHTAFTETLNPKGIGATLAARMKHGHLTFKHAKGRGEIAMKVTGVALGAAMMAFGADHAVEGMREEPRPNLSHEGVNYNHIATGAFCTAIGAALAFAAYTKPIGVPSSELVEAVLESASKSIGR